MTQNELLKEIISELDPNNRTKFTKYTSFGEFFDDDCDVVEFAIDMGELFGAELSDRDLMKLDNIEDFVAILYKRINK